MQSVSTSAYYDQLHHLLDIILLHQQHFIATSLSALCSLLWNEGIAATK